MSVFDLEEVKRDSGLSSSELVRLERVVREEFDGDEMLFELHLVRAIEAIKKGLVSMEEALSAGIRA